jgi:uncharacterized membrane protein
MTSTSRHIAPLAGGLFHLRRVALLMIVSLILLSILTTTVPLVTAGSGWTISDSKVAKAGDTVNFDISITVLSGSAKDGWAGEAYSLSAGGLPTGWTAKFYYGSEEIEAINVKIGQTVTVSMEISTTSASANGDYYLTFRAQSEDDNVVVPLKIEIRSPVRQIDLTSDFPLISTGNGNTITFPVTIKNAGEANEFINLTTYIPVGWQAQLLTVDGEDVNGLYLMAGESQSINLVLTPPIDAEAGNYSFTVEATSADGTLNVPLNLEACLYVNPQSLKMTSSLPYISTNAGRSASYSVTLTNTGKDTLFLLSTQQAPENWSVTFASGTNEIQSIFLKSGASATFTVEVTPPDTAEVGTYNLTIRASSEDGTLSNDLGLRTTISPLKREVTLSSAYPYVSSESGLSITYPITISNTGESDEWLNLSTIAPDGWEVSYATAETSGVELNSIYLTASSSTSILFEATPPENVSLGEYSFALNVTSVDGAVSASLVLKANVVAPTSVVTVLSTFTEVTAKAGSTLTFPITITNHRSTDTTFLLSVKSEPENWETVFESDNTEVSNVLLTSGQFISLVVQITPPSSVEIGNYTTTIIVQSSDGAVSQQIDLKAMIIGSYQLTVSPTAYNTQVSSGDSTSFTVRVTNNGQSPVTSLMLGVTAPDGWDVTSTPLQVQSLAAGGSSTFDLQLKTPTDATAGDYLVSVKATSDQISTDETQLRVTVNAPTSWVLWGVLVAVIVVIVMIIMYRKFGRR